MKKHLLLISLVLLTANLFAQSLHQTVKGKVYDNLTGEALPGANIIVVGSDPLIGTMTYPDGYFRLDDVPLGRQTIQIQMMGYETFHVSELLISSGHQTELDIPMEQTSYGMEEVVVKLRKDTPINTMTSVSSRQFTVEEAQRYAGGIDDPARLAASFAGVATPSVASNGISVRGNNPSGLQWRIEGVEVPNPNHFADLTVVGGGLLTAISNNMMGNSDFYTGAFPAEYGNATSGIFDINLKNGNRDQREYTVQTGLLGVDFASNGPISKANSSTYSTNYRYSTMALLAPILPEDTGILKYQDLSYKCYFPTDDFGNFSFWGISSSDKQEMAALDSSEWTTHFDRDNSQTKLYMFAGGLSHKMIINSSLLLSSSISATGNGLNHKEQRLDYNLIENPQSHIQNNLHSYSLSTNLSSRLSDNHKNQSGINIVQLDYDVDIAQSPAEGMPLSDMAKNQGNTSLVQLYSQSKLSPRQDLSLNLGIHSQMLMLNNSYSIEPRVGLKYDINNSQNIALAYGLHSRIEKMPVYFVNSEDSFPNKDLELMKSQHYVLAYNIKLNAHSRLAVEPYYQKLIDVPVSPDSYISTVNRNNDFFFNHELVNDGSGKNYGIDITLEHFLHDGFYYLATASLFNSKYRGADGIERNTRFNKNYVINMLIGNEWMLGRNNDNVLSVNFRLNYLGGNRREAIDRIASLEKKDVVYAETGDSYAFEGQYDDIPIFSFGISYRRNKAGYSSVWSLNILNATATEEYSSDYYNFRTGQIDTGFEGIMVPNLSYRIEF